jgi:hypothetical protein
MSLLHQFQPTTVHDANAASEAGRDRAVEAARFDEYYAAGGRLFSRAMLVAVADQIDAANEALRKKKEACGDDAALAPEDGVVVRIPDIRGEGHFEFDVHLGEVLGETGDGGEYFV